MQRSIVTLSSIVLVLGLLLLAGAASGAALSPEPAPSQAGSA